VLAGAVCGSKDFITTKLLAMQRHTGPNLSPFNAWVVLKGLETLSIRLAAQSERAARLARWLEEQPQVERVYYPGLASHPQHELAQRQLRGGMSGGMLSIELAGGRPAGERFLDALQVAVHATSLGSVETLCSHPASSSHRQFGEDELRAAGLSAGMVRISIGLEDADDLVEDLTRAARAATGG
jgi:cystathionine beta-lyase/cystathionine gamma-synthase